MKVMYPLLLRSGGITLARIIIVEDDEGLSRGISFSLRKDGYEVMQAFTIGEAKKQLAEMECDLMILDLNLPDGDGLDFCEWIRLSYEFPMIMLSARDLETDEVIGLEKGADDYITKPFSLAVLKARVAANLRKKFKAFSCGPIKMIPDSMKVYRQGQLVDLSTTEYKILKCLMENQGMVMTKEQILQAVWDQDANFVEENTLQVNIRRLRMKLEESPTKPQLIHTVRNMGYLLELRLEKG